MSEPDGRLPLVLDTSVAVKFYVPEEGHEQARELLAVVENDGVKLLAPSTIGAEFWNALWQKHRRGELEKEKVWETWEKFNDAPVSLFDPDSLMHAAAGIAYETEVIVYDALFLAVAEGFQTVVATADERSMLKRIRGTAYERLAVHLSNVETLLAGLTEDQPEAGEVSGDEQT
ncbi:MAG: type II toxin-antitoxin system VapC family toxin [Rubrobacteraceae bacterium]